jgi:hypothetical protein
VTTSSCRTHAYLSDMKLPAQCTMLSDHPCSLRRRRSLFLSTASKAPSTSTVQGVPPAQKRGCNILILRASSFYLLLRHGSNIFHATVVLSTRTSSHLMQGTDTRSGWVLLYLVKTTTTTARSCPDTRLGPCVFACPRNPTSDCSDTAKEYSGPQGTSSRHQRRRR